MRTLLLRLALLLLGFSASLAVSACRGDDGNEADEQADEGCTPGELNCGCNEGQCLGGLECVNDMCVSGCTLGELGCVCNGGQCLGELECVGDMCTDPRCTPGELYCECNGGQCLGELECVGNVCMEASGDTTTTGDGDTSSGTGDGETTTTTGDSDTTSGTDDTTTGDGDTTTDGGECPNANEKMCGGECIDVMSDDLNCGDCGVECPISTDNLVGGCEFGTCLPYWSECVLEDEGPTTCEQVCGAEGKACAANQCYGATHMSMDADIFCQIGEPWALVVNAACDEPVVWYGTYLRCCCD